MLGAIPRFLLPQRSTIWRARTISPSNAVQTIRNASHKAPPKPKPTQITPKVPVLEKPAKFNPPSHGSKLPKTRPQYPGPPLSEAQRAAQKMKRYPRTMPNEGTFMHWFLNNRSIHIYITLVHTPHPHSPTSPFPPILTKQQLGHTLLPRRLRHDHQLQEDLQICGHAPPGIRPVFPSNSVLQNVH